MAEKATGSQHFHRKNNKVQLIKYARPISPKICRKNAKPSPICVIFGAESIFEVKFHPSPQQNILISILYIFLNIFA